MSDTGGSTPENRPCGTQLDDGKNNSRDADASDSERSGAQSCDAVGETGEQSTLDDHLALTEDDGEGRYDCRHVYENMELEAEDGETAHFRCGSWSCYCCAHRMRMNLIESLDRLVDERPEMRRLLTLTIGDAGPDDVESQHEYLTERFNALRTELTDHYGDLSYVWIRHEGDENGRPHLHLLVDRYLPQSELSRLSKRVGLGEIVDIRRVDARNAAKYLTSYLGKGALANLTKGLRRYGSSEDVDLNVRGRGGDSREWSLLMDDYQNYRDGEPLRRSVERVDLMLQKDWGGPVPPDREPPPSGESDD